MPDLPLQIIRNGLTGSASLDTAVSRAILRRVSDNELPETLQLGQPHKVVAFGKHDALTDGFTEAVSIAIAHRFDPTIRIAGGRAVVFHRGVVRFTWTVASPDPVAEMLDRFTIAGDRVVRALGSLDINASIGELDREYCPGRYSVHLLKGGKIMGCGQRLARNAAQVAGMVVVEDAAVVNDVLAPIYSVLGLDMDPLVTGAVTDAGVVGPVDVANALANEFSLGRETLQSAIDDTTMVLARQYQPDHDPRTGP